MKTLLKIVGGIFLGVALVVFSDKTENRIRSKKNNARPNKKKTVERM